MIKFRQHSWRLRLLVLVFSVVFCGFFVGGSVFADGDTAPSSELLANISDNCPSIRQSLQTLQRADSRTRTFLGTAYESVYSHFITPLNLRLVKNNRADTELFQNQADFSSAQSNFRSQYTAYMRELETLISTDCQSHPQDFYNQLVKTRTYRETLQQTTQKLNKLVDSQYKIVKKLQESL